MLNTKTVLKLRRLLEEMVNTAVASQSVTYTSYHNLSNIYEYVQHRFQICSSEIENLSDYIKNNPSFTIDKFIGLQVLSCIKYLYDKVNYLCTGAIDEFYEYQRDTAVVIRTGKTSEFPKSSANDPKSLFSVDGILEEIDYFNTLIKKTQMSKRLIKVLKVQYYGPSGNEFEDNVRTFFNIESAKMLQRLKNVRDDLPNGLKSQFNKWQNKNYAVSRHKITTIKEQLIQLGGDGDYYLEESYYKNYFRKEETITLNDVTAKFVSAARKEPDQQVQSSSSSSSAAAAAIKRKASDIALVEETSTGR